MDNWLMEIVFVCALTLDLTKLMDPVRFELFSVGFSWTFLISMVTHHPFVFFFLTTTIIAVH